ncbi:MAG: menaquinol oxidoreductase [Candidatus Zixiibacteriota bacterium]
MEDKEKEREIFPADPNKTYGLMELVKGVSPLVTKEPEDTVMTHPHLLFRILLCSMVVMIALLLISYFFDAPLKELANPAHPESPAKAPWYFLGIQELVSHSALFGGVVIPLLIILGLIVLPYIDRSPKGVGRWFAKERRFALILFTIFVIVMGALSLIGSFFRGVNWSWVWPWQ